MELEKVYLKNRVNLMQFFKINLKYVNTFIPVTDKIFDFFIITRF